MPNIMYQISLLVSKMHQQRTDVLKENQEHIKNGGEISEEDDSDEDLDDDGDVIDAPDSDDEWDEQEKLFSAVGAKLQTGKKLTLEEMDKMGIDDDDDDSDEDYEYNGGDMNLYDSRIDDVDEISTLKQTLEYVGQQNQALYQRLQSGIPDQAQMNVFVTILNEIDQLVADEKTARE